MTLEQQEKKDNKVFWSIVAFITVVSGLVLYLGSLG